MSKCGKMPSIHGALETIMAVVPGQPARTPHFQDGQFLLRMPLNKPCAVSCDTAPPGSGALWRSIGERHVQTCCNIARQPGAGSPFLLGVTVRGKLEAGGQRGCWLDLSDGCQVLGFYWSVCVTTVSCGYISPNAAAWKGLRPPFYRARCEETYREPCAAHEWSVMCDALEPRRTSPCENSHVRC